VYLAGYGRRQRLYSLDAYRRLLTAYQQLPKVENSEGIAELGENQRIVWLKSMEAERNAHLQVGSPICPRAVT